MDIERFFAYLLPGIFTGAAYAIAASGLVLTYTTTRVFNIAHGAFGMVMAFLFWDLSQKQGLPVWLSLVIVLLVVAPITGVLVQRFVCRDLGSAPVGVGLVVTVGLFVGLIGLAQQVWPADEITTVPRFVPPFWQSFNLQLGDTTVTGHQIITVLCSIGVALGLYLLLTRTRIGTAMRAAVDNPELLKLYGGKPDLVASLAWAIGISLSALAGILLVSVVGLDYFQLTLLVINAYAAALVGRLKSLPLTFAGAMALGILDSLALGYISTESPLSDLRPAIPALFLFAVIVLMPTAQLRIGQVKGLVAAPVPTIRRMVVSAAVFLLALLVVTSGLAEAQLLLAGTAAVFALVMLSMVLLTGYGGHVSLAQFTFAGVGALTFAKLGEPNLYGLVISVLVAAAVGALVALPVLRLTGLYLALSTLAFGFLMEKVVFQAEWAFGFGGALTAERLSLLGITFSSTRSYVLAMAVIFVLVAMGVLVLRRGVVGRLLIAMRDSPAACGTLGLDQRWFRVGLFALSAGVAGLAGALFAGLRGTIGANDFNILASLPLLLLAVVFGVTSVTGATLGGIGLMLLPVLQAEEFAGIPLGGVMFMIIGVGAVFAGRDPNGLASLLFKAGRVLERRLGDQVRDRLPDFPARGRHADAAPAGVPGLGHDAEGDHAGYDDRDGSAPRPAVAVDYEDEVDRVPARG